MCISAVISPCESKYLKPCCTSLVMGFVLLAASVVWGSSKKCNLRVWPCRGEENWEYQIPSLHSKASHSGSGLQGSFCNVSRDPVNPETNETSVFR